jgi:hypothetical protein
MALQGDNVFDSACHDDKKTYLLYKVKRQQAQNKMFKMGHVAKNRTEKEQTVTEQKAAIHRAV